MKTVDPGSYELLKQAEEKGMPTAFSRAEAIKPCPIGLEGSCCQYCFMGPCRLVGKTLTGVCGATKDTVAARYFLRAVAGGAAAHSDHGRNIALTLLAVGENTAPDITIKDEKKLRKIANYFDIPEEGKDARQLAREVAKAVLADYGRQSGEIAFVRRAPKKRQELWRRLGIAPRGVDREVAESLHRTTMGVDQDASSILLQALRVALADGWGGSMYATDITDVLFGTPIPRLGQANVGVLKEDHVNIIVHGHDPVLAFTFAEVVKEPEVLQKAKERGAKGINLAGVCCTGNETLMRYGIPLAGNFLQSDLILASGVVEAMVVDYQCVMQGLFEAAEHVHTKIITTQPHAHIKGATHIEFDHHRAKEIARLIVLTAIDNFPNRKWTYIPSFVDPIVTGFSHEYIAYMQGGIFRESFRPLNDAVIQGRIRGGAGVVGCNNPRTAHDEGIIKVIKELIKNDVLVLTTGCSAIGCAKHGLTTPEVRDYAGPGLREVCEAIGIPPVLHLGSCVDNSRILTVLTQMATEGGLGEDISDLPVVGLCPEWMTEKALCIGTYFVASGVYTIFSGGPNPVAGSPEVVGLISGGWEKLVGGELEFEQDLDRAIKKALDHIDAKRKALKLVEYDPRRYARRSTYLPGDYLSPQEHTQGLYSIKDKVA